MQKIIVYPCVWAAKISWPFNGGQFFFGVELWTQTRASSAALSIKWWGSALCGIGQGLDEEAQLPDAAEILEELQEAEQCIEGVEPMAEALLLFGLSYSEG